MEGDNQDKLTVEVVGSMHEVGFPIVACVIGKCRAIRLMNVVDSESWPWPNYQPEGL